VSSPARSSPAAPPRAAAPLGGRVLLALTASVIRVLPRGWFGAASSLVSALAWPFLGKERRRAQQNIHRVFGLPPGTHFAAMFERQFFRHQILGTLETLRMVQQHGIATVTGVDELGRVVAGAEAGGRGVVVVTGHLGSWELCAGEIARVTDKTFHVLAKPSRYKAATAFLDRMRRRMRVDVFWTDRKTLLRDMLGALRAGDLVGFVMDQKPEGRKGPVVPFCGLPTEFVSGPATVAIKTGAAVVSIFCMREGPFRYRVLARELAPPRHGETDEVALTARMAAEIERVIRLYPEQWTWNYKRWRAPAG
jgi:KDO2-lipid IV(A) lauroyltransferase